jgi:hypothetical protein
MRKKGRDERNIARYRAIHAADDHAAGKTFVEREKLDQGCQVPRKPGQLSEEIMEDVQCLAPTTRMISSS